MMNVAYAVVLAYQLASVTVLAMLKMYAANAVAVAYQPVTVTVVVMLMLVADVVQLVLQAVIAPVVLI